MVNRDQRIRELAANILRMGKSIVPDRFPKPDPEVTAEWALVLGQIGGVPWEVWPDAVRLWALEHAGDRMITPKELKRAAKDVLARWETTPGRRDQLRAHRRSQEELRDQQLKDGTFAQLRGFQPREIEAKPNVEAIADLRKLALEKIQAGREKLNGDR